MLALDGVYTDIEVQPGSPIETFLLYAISRREEARLYESLSIVHAVRGSGELPRVLRQLLGKLFPEVEEQERGQEAMLSHVLENWDRATESAMSDIREQIKRNLPTER